jgi:hypothetical protein
MQILPIRQILISGHIRIISIIPLGVLLISPFVRNDECESKQKDDHDLIVSLVTADERKTYFGNSRNHANDDTGRVSRSFCEDVSTGI